MFLHELLHWKDYKTAKGATVDDKKEYIKAKAKIELDKAGINSNNVGEISYYAEQSYAKELFIEAYTEWRVKMIIEGDLNDN